MDQQFETQLPAKPEWALSRRERKRQALLAAGIKPLRFPWALVLGVLAIGGGAAFAIPQLTSLQASTPPASVEQSVAPVPKQLLSIDVANARIESLTDALKATGSLAPRRALSITSQVNGTVEDVPVGVGDRVRAGNLLVQVDVENSSLQLAQQRATADATRAQLAQAESQLARTEELAAEGLTPRSAVEAERASIAALRANLEALEAGVKAVEMVIRNATITAPFDGVVASRAVEPGQVVSGGSELLQLVDLSVMEFTAYVPVGSSPVLEPGQRVMLTVEGLGGRTFEGFLEGISPVAAQGTRTVPVLVSVANPDGALRGGMFATGRIIIDEVEDALAVPASAIRDDDDGHYVLVIADGRVERRPVEPVRTWPAAGSVQLAAGVAPGEALVAARLDDLEPGMNVTVVEN